MNMARTKRSPPEAPQPSDRVRWYAALVLLAGALTYANSFSAPFIFDDQATIVQNATIHDLTRLDIVFAPPENTPVAGRPLVNFSFAMNYAFGGLDPAGYHAINVGIHLECALLIFGLVRRTLLRFTAHCTDLAFAVALLWVVHPLNSETVDYVTQRTESLMALFYLLTLYASVRAAGSKHASRWYMASIAACLAGMACKETMVTAPAMMVLYDRVFLFDSFRQAFRARGGFYAALAGTWLLLAALVASHGQTLSSGFGTARVSVWTYLLNQTVMLTRYLWLSVWPQSLVLYYGWPQPLTLADVWPYAAFIVVLLIATGVVLVRYPRFGFVAAWVFITLAPTSSVLPIATEVGAERRMYLPLVGVIALIAVTASLMASAFRRKDAAVVLLIAVALSARTIARNREYRSPLTMAETVLARWPSASAENLVGTELAALRRHAEAVPHLQEAARAYPPARYFLGTELLTLGRIDEGIAELRAFVRDEPHLLATRAAHGLLANALAERRSFVDAIPHYREYLAAHPQDGTAWTGLGIALVETGKTGDALWAFRGAVRADPANPRFRVNLARALLDHGDLDEAARLAQEAATTNPADPAAHDVLGRVYVGRGQLDAARAAFMRALQLDPAYAPAREALSSIAK
jgi:protein O-mannosyl-transferase